MRTLNSSVLPQIQLVTLFIDHAAPKRTAFVLGDPKPGRAVQVGCHRQGIDRPQENSAIPLGTAEIDGLFNQSLTQSLPAQIGVEQEPPQLRGGGRSGDDGNATSDFLIRFDDP